MTKIVWTIMAKVQEHLMKGKIGSVQMKWTAKFPIILETNSVNVACIQTLYGPTTKGNDVQ